jgi:hypothetical protein
MEVRATFPKAKPLTTAGATVVFLHHTGKAETAKQFRGSMDFKGAVDAFYYIKASMDSKGYLDQVSLARVDICGNASKG